MISSNFSNLTSLLEVHKANPNAIIPKLDISTIHYAVGFDDAEFAEKATLELLKHGADPNLASLGDNLTPLHIACIWGREKIVKMLLQHGGDLDIKSDENQTAITYAIQEDHYKVIETIKNFVFEKKLKKKTRKNILLHKFEELKFTPNRINYNFDVSSPYYVNITHRRHKTSDKFKKKLDMDEQEVQVDEEDDDDCNKKNLFELTEKNVKEFSKQLNTAIVINRLAIHKRRSYIKNWQESIRQIRRTCSKLDLDYINYLNKCNDVTLMTSDEHKETDEDEESFFTAENKVKEEVADDDENVIEILEEDYFHSDVENKVIFCERRFLPKKELMTDDSDHESLYSTQLPPLDYDTDVLRAEFEYLTGQKAIIGKDTKKLFLKRVIKLKKRNDKEQNNEIMKKGNHCNI